MYLCIMYLGLCTENMNNGKQMSGCKDGVSSVT